MILLEIFVGAVIAVIFMSVGHTLGEAKADKDIITRFNEVEAKLRVEIRKELITERLREGGVTSHVFSNMDDANSVLDKLTDSIESYGYVMVAHYKDLIGEESTWTDWDTGWYSTDEMEVRKVANGYMLEIPYPVNMNIKGEK